MESDWPDLICYWGGFIIWYFPTVTSVFWKSQAPQRIPFWTIGQTFTGGWFCFLGLQSECYELEQNSLKLPFCHLLWKAPMTGFEERLWLNFIEIQKLASEESFSGQIYINLTCYIVLATFSRVFFLLPERFTSKTKHPLST